jgi:hypothetical protein
MFLEFLLLVCVGVVYVDVVGEERKEFVLFFSDRQEGGRGGLRGGCSEDLVGAEGDL